MNKMLYKKVGFADDLTSWVIEANINDAVEKTKSDLLSLMNWTKKWRLKINAGKTEFILFGKNHSEIEIKVNNTILPQVKSKKVLGVIFQENFTFSEHVDHLKSKSFKALSLVSPLMSANGGGPAEIGIFLYETCIRSIMEAVFPVWCMISVTEFRKLEEVQRSALRAATGTRHGFLVISYTRDLVHTPYDI